MVRTILSKYLLHVMRRRDYFPFSHCIRIRSKEILVEIGSQQAVLLLEFGILISNTEKIVEDSAMMIPSRTKQLNNQNL